MQARIMKVDEKRSKYGGIFYYVFFKDTETGQSIRSCIDPKMGNYKRWHEFLAPGVVLGNLRTITRRDGSTLIDADSLPEFIRKEEAA